MSDEELKKIRHVDEQDLSEIRQALLEFDPDKVEDRVGLVDEVESGPPADADWTFEDAESVADAWLSRDGLDILQTISKESGVSVCYLISKLPRIANHIGGFGQPSFTSRLMREVQDYAYELSLDMKALSAANATDTPPQE